MFILYKVHMLYTYCWADAQLSLKFMFSDKSKARACLQASTHVHEW